MVKKAYNRRLSKKIQVFLQSALSKTKMLLIKRSLNFLSLKDRNLHARVNHYSQQINHRHLNRHRKKSSSSLIHQLDQRPIHCSRQKLGSNLNKWKKSNSISLPITLQKKASQWWKSQQISRWIKISSLSKGQWLSIKKEISVVCHSHRIKSPIRSSKKVRPAIHCKDQAHIASSLRSKTTKKVMNCSTPKSLDIQDKLNLNS